MISICPSFIWVVALFLLSLCLTCFSVAIDTLKSHRIIERLQSLSGLFFYLSIHRKLFGSALQKLRICVTVAKSLLQYTFLTSLILFISLSSEFGLQDRLVPSRQIALLIVTTLLAWLFTDPLPRLFATRYPMFFLKIASLPSSFVCLALIVFNFPLIKLLSWQEGLEEQPVKDPTYEVREKMMEILHDFESSTAVDSQNRSLLHGFIKYQDRVVREIMIPRVEIFCLAATTTINDAASLILREGYTRVPVYEDSIDNLLGVIMAKDLLKVYLGSQESKENDFGRTHTIASYVKPVLYTPENKRVSALLQEFRKHHMHLAIVVDEYGGTEGLVTIEDILEEIVGDIEDEYDLGEKPFTLLSDGSYLVDAHIGILDLNEQVGINIPTHGDYDTLSGYIFSKLGSIPTKGLVIHQNEFELEVIDANERSVEKVRIRLTPTQGT